MKIHCVSNTFQTKQNKHYICSSCTKFINFVHVLLAMNTVLARLNAIFAFSLTVLAVCTLFLFVSTVLLDNHLTNVTILPSQVRVRNVREFPRSSTTSDLGYLVFDLSANLSHLFHWNCKEVFLYLTAEYQTDNNIMNQVILNISTNFS